MAWPNLFLQGFEYDLPNLPVAERNRRAGELAARRRHRRLMARWVTYDQIQETRAFSEHMENAEILSAALTVCVCLSGAGYLGCWAHHSSNGGHAGSEAALLARFFLEAFFSYSPALLAHSLLVRLPSQPGFFIPFAQTGVPAGAPLWLLAGHVTAVRWIYEWVNLVFATIVRPLSSLAKLAKALWRGSAPARSLLSGEPWNVGSCPSEEGLRFPGRAYMIWDEEEALPLWEPRRGGARWEAVHPEAPAPAGPGMVGQSNEEDPLGD